MGTPRNNFLIIIIFTSTVVDSFLVISRFLLASRVSTAVCCYYPRAYRGPRARLPTLQYEAAERVSLRKKGFTNEYVHSYYCCCCCVHTRTVENNTRTYPYTAAAVPGTNIIYLVKNNAGSFQGGDGVITRSTTIPAAKTGAGGATWSRWRHRPRPWLTGATGGGTRGAGRPRVSTAKAMFAEGITQGS